MGLFDKVRGAGSRRRLSLELGRDVSLLELKGDREVTAAGRAAPGGAVGADLGRWLRGWFESLGVTARSARVVLVDGDIQHHLVTMPEMSDSDRYLAAGAEVRKLSSAPTQQVAYSHLKVGDVDQGGVSRERVLISIVDRSTVRNAVDAIEAAGLELDTITTIPPTLLEVAGDLGDLAGGTAMAWLSTDRCYLVVVRNGVAEMVRDFRLRGVEDGLSGGDAVATELRRSFLFFGQQAHGAAVERVLLAGPLPGLHELVRPLRQSLDLDVELFEAAGLTDPHDLLPASAGAAAVGALGAARIKGSAKANLIAPEEVTEGRVRRFFSVGRLAAGLVLLALVGWGVLSLLSAGVQEQRLTRAQERLTQANADLQQARSVTSARADHAARRALLEDRALESALVGTAMQRISRNMSEEVTLNRLAFERRMGPGGQTYWDAQFHGFAFGSTRSESQAVFNGYYSRLAGEPVVDTIHLVEPLIIGSQEARQLSPLTVAARQGPGAVQRQQSSSRPLLATTRRTTANSRYAPESWRADVARRRSAQAGISGGGTTSTQPGEVRVRTPFDDLPAFGPTETSVAFNVAIQLKAIASGGSR